ncbi:TPA: AlpA family phage regulatory protein [Enterobacter cloacae subsp. cloacae]|nr:AlpA family phage regulatory protein [Enterobacter cloacae]HCM9269007.1 AlpA family phage regulatory protein [Enterobacter cloacae subsp. cloacae]HCM9540631.1 AlpA family phage regulatory protein [Enterobacter cloacae subsp. cloacae]
MTKDNEILLTHEVKEKLRYSSNSAFYEFMKDCSNEFPLPFKVGNRNCWYRRDVDSWLEKRSQTRGLISYGVPRNQLHSTTK